MPNCLSYDMATNHGYLKIKKVFYYMTYRAFVDTLTKPNINITFNLLLHLVHIQQLSQQYCQQNA